MVVEKGGGRRRILQVERMETIPGKGLEVGKEKAVQSVDWSGKFLLALEAD